MGYETLGLISKYIQWALGIAIAAITLSEKEIKLLESKTRGKCLFCAGNIRLELRVDVPDMLIEMMGKAGGR